MFCLLNYFHWFVYEILPYVDEAVPSVGSKQDSSFDGTVALMQYTMMAKARLFVMYLILSY
jgi:hypothetical protein